MEVDVLEATARGNLHLLQQYLAFNPSFVHTVNSDDDTPLHIAASSNQIECVRLLLRYGASVNALGCSSRSPLICATVERHRQCIELLLQAGAELDLDDSLNETPLHKAASNDDEYTTYLFLTHNGGQDAKHIINHPNVLGSTALHNAAYCGHTRVMQLLIDYGADYTLTDNFNYTALDVARNKGHNSCVNYLLSVTERNQSANAGIDPALFSVMNI